MRHSLCLCTIHDSEVFFIAQNLLKFAETLFSKWSSTAATIATLPSQSCISCFESLVGVSDAIFYSCCLQSCYNCKELYWWPRKSQGVLVRISGDYLHVFRNRYLQ